MNLKKLERECNAQKGAILAVFNVTEIASLIIHARAAKRMKKALRELIECLDLRDRIDTHIEQYPNCTCTQVIRWSNDYLRRKPLALEAVRAALAKNK